MNIMMDKLNTATDFESRLFKAFVLPGIVLEVLMLFLFCVPTGLTINLLSRSIGGPGGIAIQAGMLPCVILALTYIAVACVYTIILPYKYCKLSITFLGSARRFLIFSTVLFLILDFIALAGWIEFIRWDYFHILNLPVVLSLNGFVFTMTVVFLYWTIRIYRYQKLRLFSWKTLEGIGLFLTALALALIVLLLLI